MSSPDLLLENPQVSWRAKRLLRRMVSKPGRCLILIAVLSFLLNAALFLFLGVPRPQVHDEFSYLLAADTFAHGRITNPTHPLWKHFESFHIIQQPTYASKYPPGQGLVLAAGQVLAGQPIVGVWLSSALACAAIGWMLMAWMPTRWAFVGGMLAILHPTVLEWSWSYWGGSLAMGGGALVLGAMGRLAGQLRLLDSLLMAIGMAILANTRPYEGLVLSLLAGIYLLLAWIKDWHPSFTANVCKRLVLPVSIVLAGAAVGMGYYNLRVTGHPLRMPYVVHEETYAAAPSFLWQSPRSGLIYHHKELQDFWLGWVMPMYEHQRSAPGFAEGVLWKVQTVIRGCFPTFITALPLLGLPWAFRSHRGVRLALILGGLFFLALLPTIGIAPHYAAPIFGLVFLLAVAGIRQLCLWNGWHAFAANSRRPETHQPAGRRNHGIPQAGQLLVGGILLLWVAWLIPQGFALARSNRSEEWREQISQRAEIMTRLNQEPGSHLVIVRYGPNHNTHAEWVYNDADIDAAKVVWAREMDDNRLLLEYFVGHRIWLLLADQQPPRLDPYYAHLPVGSP